jgi:PBP1b-binding outer membrane lipoprotein LpoB
MTKLLAITFVAFALSACSSTTSTRSMGNTTGNPSETKNSTDANKSGNPAAVSPAGGGGTGTGAGTAPR